MTWAPLRCIWNEKKHGYVNKEKIIMRWTCCDMCHIEHKSLISARLHYYFLRIAQLIGAVNK